MSNTNTKTIQTQQEAMMLLGDIHSYDKILVMFSGGKDSIALFLYLKEQGVDMSKVELWHHDIDGDSEKVQSNFMDWTVTKGYCKAFADAFSVPIYFSWRDGGFKREMLRNGQYEASKSIPDLLDNPSKKEFCKRNKVVSKEVLDGVVSFTMQEVECEMVDDKLTRVKPETNIGEEFTLIVDKAAFTGAIFYEDENHNVQSTEPSYNPLYIGKREKFPQVTADLSTRWCSSALKIDACASAIRNQDRFKGSKTLVLTGERSQESMGDEKFEQMMDGTLPDEDRKGRATYNILEADRSDNRNGKTARFINHFRPIRDWRESDVWAIMERHGVRPHVAYEIGYGRVSCMNCIFGNADQWASSMMISPSSVNEIIELEGKFGVTIHREKSVKQRIPEGSPYEGINPERIALANSKVYTEDIIVPVDEWELPAGAYGESCGPPT
jgi:3'-phosphoadenosine 5'-phosphosulfate sulfotransferase (PAPS reductase)/FAD synthetase